MEGVYEAFFFLKYAGGWSFAEAYNLPVGLRRWFTERLVKQLETEAEATQEAMSGGRGTTLTAENSPPLPPHLAGQFGKTE